MSLFSSSKCVLVMGDEGLQIFKAQKNNVKRVLYASWNAEDFTARVQEAIVKDCKRAPIIILNDMVEQHYRKERIPKVSPIDQSNVVKRRLGIAFPNYRVRAALKLKDKKSLATGDQKGNPYLFAAVPASDFFNKTLDAVRISGASLVGFFLLPVEASSIVSKLSKKLTRKNDTQSRWTIFIGQHHNGGLRQVVTRNGELALTRLTPIVDTDVEADLWVKEVVGELDATMSYLARFGYQEIDGLDIIISANDACKPLLEQAININSNLHVMNAQSIAKLLGQSLGPQEDLRYTDPLYAGFLANQRSYILPLQSVAISQMTQPHKIATFLMALLSLGIAYFGYGAFQNWTKSADLQNQLLVATQQNQSLRQEYNLELNRQKELGFDFLLVDNAIQIHEVLEQGKATPLPIIREIGQALGVDVKLDKLDVNVKSEQPQSNQIRFDENGNEIELQPQKFMEALLTISFPSTVAPEVGVRKVNEIRNKLASSLLNYEVRVVKQIADLSYTGNFTGGAGLNQADNSPEEYSAEISIRGDLR